MKLCQVYNIASHYRTAIYSLIDKNFECDLFCSKNSTDIKSMNLSQLKGRTKEVNTISIGNLSYQIGIPSLAFKKYDAYLVTGDTWCVSTWLLLFLCKIFRKDVYLWSHGLLGRENGIKKKLNLLFVKLAKGVFLYGDRAKQLLIKEGINAKSLHVVYNSLDYESQLKLRESSLRSNIYENHFKEKSKTLIFIGRLTKVKRLDLILDALSIMNNRGNKVNLVVVGNGSEYDSLSIKVKNDNLSEQVWFYGASYDEKNNAELIYNADLCVAPGNVGLTAIHTLMFGTPVITNSDFSNQMPEFEAIVENVTGDFFEKGNVEALADSITRWLKTHSDRESVRCACYQEIDSRWNPEYQIQVFNKVLKKQ